MTLPEFGTLDTRGLHGGVYVVREHTVTHQLVRPPRRLGFTDVTISTDRCRDAKAPRLSMRVNPDWSITIDTARSRRGLGIISFPILRTNRAESLQLGVNSPLVDFTIAPTESDDMAVLMNTMSDALLRTRVLYVAPKA